MTKAIPANLPEVSVEKVQLTLRLDATVTVFDATGQATDWLKPGAESSITWRGGIPEEAEVKLGYKYLHQRNADALEEVLTQVRARLDSVQRGR